MKLVRNLSILLVLIGAVALHSDPSRSRWVSLKTGITYEIADYGDRIGLTVVDTGLNPSDEVEKPDVSVGGPRRLNRRPHGMLTKQPDGRYIGAWYLPLECNWSKWVPDDRHNSCLIEFPVSISIGDDSVRGWTSKPAIGTSFDCQHCRFKKIEQVEVFWEKEGLR